MRIYSKIDNFGLLDVICTILAINQDKPHYNDINSMGAMIFCSIK